MLSRRRRARSARSWSVRSMRPGYATAAVGAEAEVWAGAGEASSDAEAAGTAQSATGARLSSVIQGRMARKASSPPIRRIRSFMGTIRQGETDSYINATMR
jgi:hypothetical protein